MKRILIIGGDSRLGRAIARAATCDVSSVRRRNAGVAGAFTVTDYRSIPAETFAGYSTVINCVGATAGGGDDLAEANVQTPISIARSAAAGGVELFVQISSFSIFGSTQLIQHGQNTTPTSAYGQSKLQAEQALQELLQDDLKLAIVRFPMLYGCGRSKLDDLLRLWVKLRIMPMPPGDIARSMLHYDLAAQFLLWVVQQRHGGVFTVADPKPFSYRRVVDVLRNDASVQLHTLKLPDLAFGVVRYLRPKLHASLFEDSLLSPDINDLLQTGLHSRLYDDIPRIARNILDD